MYRQQRPVARVLPEEHIKHKTSGNERANKQKNQIISLGNAREVCNTGNGDMETIMKNNSDASSCKNVHDTMIEIVQAVKWTHRVYYGEVNNWGFIGL